MSGPSSEGPKPEVKQPEMSLEAEVAVKEYAKQIAGGGCDNVILRDLGRFSDDVVHPHKNRQFSGGFQDLELLYTDGQITEIPLTSVTDTRFVDLHASYQDAENVSEVTIKNPTVVITKIKLMKERNAAPEKVSVRILTNNPVQAREILTSSGVDESIIE